ncbi:MAG: DNA-3-methyladenine glycosylase family protein, partial [bacterium]
AIIGQQVNLSFAYMLSRRFIESFAESYEHGGRLYWLFPSTQSIAELSVVELRKLQFTQRKAEYVIGLAQQFENGELSKEKLLHYKNSNDARNVLLGIRGVGAWTANYVLMRCLGDPSAFPIEDIGLHRAIQLRLNLTRKPTIDEIRSLATGWENWQAYATFYLYRSLL